MKRKPRRTTDLTTTMKIFKIPPAAAWIKHKHLFGSDKYECSACRSQFKMKAAICPNCGARMTKTKFDPKRIDETEMFDIISN